MARNEIVDGQAPAMIDPAWASCGDRRRPVGVALEKDGTGRVKCLLLSRAGDQKARLGFVSQRGRKVERGAVPSFSAALPPFSFARGRSLGPATCLVSAFFLYSERSRVQHSITRRLSWLAPSERGGHNPSGSIRPFSRIWTLNYEPLSWKEASFCTSSEEWSTEQDGLALNPLPLDVILGANQSFRMDPN